MKKRPRVYQPNFRGRAMREYDNLPRATRDLIKEYAEYRPERYLSDPVRVQRMLETLRRCEQERKLNEVL